MWHAAAPAFGLRISCSCPPCPLLASNSLPFVPQPSPVACAAYPPCHPTAGPQLAYVASPWQACRCFRLFFPCLLLFPPYIYGTSLSSLPLPSFCSAAASFSSLAHHTAPHHTAPYPFETPGLPDPFAFSCLASASFMGRPSRLAQPGQLGAMPYPAAPPPCWLFGESRRGHGPCHLHPPSSSATTAAPPCGRPCMPATRLFLPFPCRSVQRVRRAACSLSLETILLLCRVVCLHVSAPLRH